MTLGMIGTSKISHRFARAAKEAGISLCALYSRTEEKGERFAREEEIPQVCTDLEEFLSLAFDTVYIASPNGVHFCQALEAVRHKKHVLVEKLSFVTEAQAAEVLGEAEKNGVFVLECIRNVYNPMMDRLRNSLELIAPVRYAYFTHMKYSSQYDAFKEGRRPPVFMKEFAGGASSDLGIYCAYAAVALFGIPEKSVCCATALPDGGADGVCTQVLQYPEMLCVLSSGKVSHTERPCEIQGERGTLLIDHIADLQQITLAAGGEKKVLWAQRYENDLVHEARELSRMIAEKDTEAYEKSKRRLLACVSLLEQGRRQSGVLFPQDAI